MIKLSLAKKFKSVLRITAILQGIAASIPFKVLAADPEDPGGPPSDPANPTTGTFGKLSHPLENLRGSETGEGLGTLINNLVTFATYIAGIALLGYLIYGGISWIVAGGNEDQVEKAQKTISNAVIGIVIVVAAIMITQILGNVLGFENILQPTFPGAGTGSSPTP